MKDYYQLLGVKKEAPGDEIKKAYRKLALTFHPDRNGGDSACEERLKEINEAYQVLGDEEKRRQYDLIRRQVYGTRTFFEGDLSEEIMRILREFSRESAPMRGPGGCRGGGFKRRGCGRWRGQF